MYLSFFVIVRVKREERKKEVRERVNDHSGHATHLALHPLLEARF